MLMGFHSSWSYQLQIGFEVSSTNGIHRIRFPNGEMQPFKLQNTGLAQWHTNVQAQEESLPTKSRTEWMSTVTRQSVLSEEYWRIMLGSTPLSMNKTFSHRI